MAKVRLCARVLACLGAIWIVAQGLAQAVAPVERPLSAPGDFRAADSEDAERTVLEQLAANEHLIFGPGRCSVELTWGRRQHRGMQACIAQAR
jgi:hypothetical protein